MVLTVATAGDSVEASHIREVSVKVFGIIATAAVLAVASPAQAQPQQSKQFEDKIDLAAITCKEFQALDGQTISLILMWMTGYYADEDAPAIIDLKKFGEDAKKLGRYCSANPSAAMTTAAEETISEQ